MMVGPGWLGVGIAVMAAVATVFGIIGEENKDKFMAGAFKAASISEQGSRQIKSVLLNGGDCSILASDYQKVCGMLKDAERLHANSGAPGGIDPYHDRCDKMRFDMQPACEAAKHITLNP